MAILGEAIEHGTPIHAGDFVYVFTPSGTKVYTKKEFETLVNGSTDPDK